MKKKMIVLSFIVLSFLVIVAVIAVFVNKVPEICNDNGCEIGENKYNCSSDCEISVINFSTTGCGDGVCNLEETCSSCESDCGECEYENYCDELYNKIHKRIYETKNCDNASDCRVIDTCFSGAYRLVNKEFENELKLKIEEYDAECVQENDSYCPKAEGIYCGKKECWSFLPD